MEKRHERQLMALPAHSGSRLRRHDSTPNADYAKLKIGAIYLVKKGNFAVTVEI
jgi:hypothetical protein